MRTIHRLLGYRRRKEQRSPSVYHGRSTAHCIAAVILCIFFQDREFFQSRLAIGHSSIVRAWLDLATLSSVFLVPLAFSLCPDANGRIDLLAIGSYECFSTTSGELEVEWGIDRAPGDEGLLNSR